jgi:hypothetical protein
MKMNKEEQREVVDRIINTIMLDGYNHLLDLEYMDDIRVAEVTEIIIAVVARPYVLPNPNQLRLFK